jgi:hypothetical protein
VAARRGEFDSDLEPPARLRKNKGRPPDPRRTRPTEFRACRRHGRVEFALYGVVRPRWFCKKCVSDAVTRRQQKVKRVLVEEAGGRCAVCGYSRTVVNLQFHHIDPSKKTMRMDASRGKALDTYRAEAKKCVLVCANCHGEIESGVIESPPAQATYKDYGSRRKRGKAA